MAQEGIGARGRPALIAPRGAPPPLWCLANPHIPVGFFALRVDGLPEWRFLVSLN